MKLALGLMIALTAMGQEPAPAPAPGPAAPAAPVVPLTAVRSVYLLPMGSGFDQYLANHLTRTGVVQVVVDPAQADAVITPQLGQSLEEKLKELYPGATKTEAADDAKSDQEDYRRMVRGSGFSRSRGNVFLVDPHSRRVIWSTWLPPKSTQANDLDRAARQIVERLQDAVKRLAP